MYLIIHLLPDTLISQNFLLKKQKKALLSYIQDIIIPNLTANISTQLSLPLFEKILTGILKPEKQPIKDILEHLALSWYPFTKKTHASLGPRIGNFTEYLIGYWLKTEFINYPLDKFLQEYFGICINNAKKSKIDFIQIKDSHLNLIELRTSEHTGGKTSQESLTDKLVQILNYIENPHISLRKILLNYNIYQVNLYIAILFNEQGELLNTENFNQGRLTSLIQYLSEIRHLGTPIYNLLQQGYKLYINNIELSTSNLNPETLSSILKEAFSKHRKILLKYDNFTIQVAILFGNEFFKTLTGKTLEELLNETLDILGDDFWLFYTITINELRLKAEFKYSTIDLILKFLEEKNILEKFNQLQSTTSSIDDFSKNLYSFISNLIPQFIQECEKKGKEIKPLSTNNLIALYKYLTASFLLALTIKYLQN